MATQCAFGENEHAILRDFEHSTTPLQQLDGRVRKSLLNLGSQTGRPGLVVSNDAIADSDVHKVGVSAPQCSWLRSATCQSALGNLQVSVFNFQFGGTGTPARFAS